MEVLEIVRRYLPRVPDRGSFGEELDLPCPFHKSGQEETPSFRVNLLNGLSFCHRCQKGWNLFTLLLELGVSREIARQLSDGADVVGEPTFEEKQQKPELLIPEYVLSSYAGNCPTSLLEAGFKKEILREYEVGYDRVNERIVFPLRDYKGRLVAIIGRNMVGEERGRYKVYKKELEPALGVVSHVEAKHHLWNFHRWYNIGFVGSLDYLIIVEGIKKALWLIQHGWEKSVALNGSYTTDEQALLLSRVRVGITVLFLDDNDAGRTGVQRLKRLLTGRTRIVVPSYPSGRTEPDECNVGELATMLQRDGGASWVVAG